MKRETLLQHLAEIEERFDVKILYAAESGSRAWGFASPDSDWDVRFIYAHRLDWYLKITPEREVIEVMLDDKFDASGWDIRKALSLFRKSNPPLIEWLHAPIVYKDLNDFRASMLRLQTLYFNPDRALLHYFHLASNQNKRYLQRKDRVLKCSLYYLRSLLACRWLLTYGTPPPVPFDALVRKTVKEGEVLNEIGNLLALKSQSRTHDKEAIPPLLNDYGRALEAEIAEQINNRKIRPSPPETDQPLDALMKSTLLDLNEDFI